MYVCTCIFNFVILIKNYADMIINIIADLIDG